MPSRPFTPKQLLGSLRTHEQNMLIAGHVPSNVIPTNQASLVVGVHEAFGSFPTTFPTLTPTHNETSQHHVIECIAGLLPFYFTMGQVNKVSELEL